MRGKIFFGAAFAAMSAVWGISNVAYADPTIKWKGAPETDEEDRSFKVTGRVMYDVYNIHDSGTPLLNLGSTGAAPGAMNSLEATRSATRRAFLGVAGHLTQNWHYDLKWDINPDGGGSVKADDFFIEYAGSTYSIFIGQNNAIAPMENRDSSLAIPFNERSGINNAFAPNDKQMGIAYLTNGGNWSAGAGFFGDQLQTKADNTSPAVNEAGEERVRLTYAPIYERTPEGTKLVHLGVYARHRDTNGDAFFSYATIPNVNFAVGANKLATPADFASDNYVSGEFAIQYNQFGVDGEFGELMAKRGSSSTNGVIFGTGVAGVSDPTFKGGYVGIYFSPTGESRSYNAADGSFKNIVPTRTLGSDGGIGHIMLSARYDVVDLNDSGFNGGKQTSVIGGVTWVPIDHVKFQLNYSQNKLNLSSSTLGALPASEPKGTANVVVLRTQLDF